MTSKDRSLGWTFRKAKTVIVIWSERIRGEATEASHRGTLLSTTAPGFDPRGIAIYFLALHCEPVTYRERILASIGQKGVKRRVPGKAINDEYSIPFSEAPGRPTF